MWFLPLQMQFRSPEMQILGQLSQPGSDRRTQDSTGEPNQKGNRRRTTILCDFNMGEKLRARLSAYRKGIDEMKDESLIGGKLCVAAYFGPLPPTI